MMQQLTLNNGMPIPIAGYGVFQIPDPADCTRCVIDAIGTGYRLIDTAASYMNEAAIGEGIRLAGVPREQLLVTSNYLYLMHQPYGDAGASSVFSHRDPATSSG